VKLTKIPTLHEMAFRDANDPIRHAMEESSGSPGSFGSSGYDRHSKSVDLSQDSFIFVFTGSRGSGKSEVMTMMACKAWFIYHARIIANYPIMFRAVDRHGKSTIVKSEPVDFYKLIMHDSSYHNAIICLDEAPILLSHMSSMSLKNRLFDLWVQQLRKNRNSLFMCAQSISWLDKGARMQTDVEVECIDLTMLYPEMEQPRGAVIGTRYYDESGRWAGHQGKMAAQLEWKCKVLWGDPKEGIKPVYDTYQFFDPSPAFYKIDRELSMKAMASNTGHKDEETWQLVEEARELAFRTKISGDKILCDEFYAELQTVDKKIKDKISKWLADRGAKVKQRHDGKRMYDFSLANLDSDV